MKKNRILVTTIVLAFFLVAYLSLAADVKYVGSANSKKYHNPDCKWAKKISPKNVVTFKTAQDALEAGYVPCKVCKPPTKD